MIGKLFSPTRKLQHDDARVRAEFLDALSSDKAAGIQSELLAALKTEPDPTVASRLVERVSNVEDLVPLLDGTWQAPIAQRLASSGHSSDHPAVLKALAEQAQSEDEVQRLLARISSTELAAELALLVRPPWQEMLLQHHLLRGTQALQHLELSSRSKNKRVNRYAREQLEQIKTTSGRLVEATERLKHVADKARAVAAGDAEDAVAREVRRSHLVALKGEFDAFVSERKTLIETLADLGEPTATEDDGNPFDGLDLSPPEASPYGAVLAELEAQLENAQPPASQEALQLALSQAESKWSQLAAHQDATDEETARYAAARDILNQAIDAWHRLSALADDALHELTAAVPEDADQAEALWAQAAANRKSLKAYEAATHSIEWPQALPTPAELQSRDDHARQARAQLEELEAARAEIETRLSETMKRAEAALGNGETKQTQGALSEARKLLGRLPPAQRRQADGRISALYAQLGEMKDWQTFATTPKREALIAEMQALAGKGLAPEALAEQIKRVRAEWNGLGRPANRQEHAQQATFDAAAEQAFEPCRAYFEEENKKRDANLAQREALVAELSAYVEQTDWSSADFPAAEKIMRAARNEWRAAHPVPRGKGKSLTKKFEGLQSRIHGELKQEWDRNIARKEALIERMQTALGSEDNAAQIQLAKSLQAEWKAIGQTPRQHNQRLWKAFRAACDAAFDRRSADLEAKHAAIDANYAAAQALMDGFEAQTDSAPSAASLRAFRSQFNELGELGRQRGAARQRFNALCDAYEEKLAERARQQQRDDLKNIKAEDARLAEAEAGGADAASELALFRQRAPVANALQQLTDLVITAEIVAERASPDEDSVRRMEIQVDLMNRGGKASLPGRDELLKQWCSTSAAGVSADLTPLRERFFDAL